MASNDDVWQVQLAYFFKALTKLAELGAKALEKELARKEGDSRFNRGGPH